MSQEILSQVSINSSDLHAEMNRIRERDKTVGFRAQKTIDYLDSLGVLPLAKSKELFEKLSKLEVPRLRDVHFNKLIDLMPSNVNDVKVVLQGYNVTVSQESCKKIADLIAEYV